jgi:hypothetical protein
MWTGAATLENFYQIFPGDNVSTSKPTKVLIGFDKENLYLGFLAFDEPEKVRATIAKRDAIFDDDTVRILFDTYDDQRRAYVLWFNPLGIQADGIHTEGVGIDYSVDVVMESKGRITSEGYVVEVAVPFKSLRRKTGKDRLWGVHVFRQIKRFDNETDSWMPISRDKTGLLNQEGYIAGLEGIDSERALEIIPSLAVSQTGRRAPVPIPQSSSSTIAVDAPERFVNNPLSLDPGLTVKFGITPTVSLDLTVNPDFAQVEADQFVVTANQRFPIFFQEKRPFFLEGKDYFQTPITAVHTRAIIDPDFAGKLTGKLGRNNFGILFASDNAPGDFSEDERNNPSTRQSIERFLDKNAYVGVLRYKRDLGKENTIGLLVTSYSFIEKHNQLGGFDGQFRLDAKTLLSFQVLGTTSRRFFFDPELNQKIYRTGNALAYRWSLDHGGRRFGFNLSGEGYSRDYRADIGFTLRTNTNTKRLFLSYDTQPRPKAGIIRYRSNLLVFTNFDWQGRMQRVDVQPMFGVQLRHQTSLTVGYRRGYERLFEEEFGPMRTPTHPGAFSGDDPERSIYKKSLIFIFDSTPNKKWGMFAQFIYDPHVFDFDLGAGPRFPRVSPLALVAPGAPLDPGAGSIVNLQTSLRYQPTDALRMSLDYNKQRLIREDTGLVAFDDNIYSLRTTYYFTRFTFLRARVDYQTIASKVRGQFLLGWTPNPGTSFYVGYNDDLNFNGFNPFTGQPEPGLRRNGRVLFTKFSYLLRRSF